MASRLRVGDQVVVVSGDDKGNTGVIRELVDGGAKVVVTGLNLVTRSKKGVGGAEGTRVSVEAPLWSSKVMPVDPTTGKATRVRHLMKDAGKVRVAVRSGAVLEWKKAE